MAKEITRKRNKDYDREYCKKYYQKNKEKLLKEKKQYRITFFKKYPWKRAYYDLKNRCNNINNSRFNRYGGRGIRCLITEEEIKEIWFRDKAYDMKRASIDRINNNKDYIYSNCRFIEFTENSTKNKLKPILQFDLDNNYIKEWKSIKEASETLKVSQANISACCHKKYGYKTCKGFIWRFKNDTP